MENWVAKSEQMPSVSESSSESMGDSEAELVHGHADMNVFNYDDDAESTSGDNSSSSSSRSIDEDFDQQDHMRRKLLCCKEYRWHDHDMYDVKHMMMLDHDREVVMEDQMAEEEMAVAVEVAAQVDNAETNRLFWDACIAHGY